MRNVLDWLEAAAEQKANQIAYDSPNQSLTWKECRDRALGCGSKIARIVDKQSPILIFMEKTPDCIVAMLGCIYAGCFYTPIDSAMPLNRIEKIVSVLKPKLILCEQHLYEKACALNHDAKILIFSEIEHNIDATINIIRSDHIDNDLLYVLFTSGSTGVPKGVSVTHRSVIDYIEWACRDLFLPDGLRMGNQAPFYFDNSVLDIYGAMAMQGSLYLIPKSEFMFPKKLLETLEREKIDTIFWVPSALTSLSVHLPFLDKHLSFLKRIFFCGEVMPCSTLNRFIEVLPHTDYVNMYGPTEITDVCTYYRVDRKFDDTDKLPIGKPCDNTRVYLIDGEICVTGTCLSAGYYNDPKKTAEVFVQNPFRPQIQEIIYKTGDMGEYNAYGELMFLGRRDSQIKKSGYRIELGEIETHFSGINGVELSCCMYASESEKIVAVYTGEISRKEIKAQLRKLIPSYMIPELIIQKEVMPLLDNGKIDRLQLKQEIFDEYSIH